LRFDPSRNVALLRSIAFQISKSLSDIYSTPSDSREVRLRAAAMAGGWTEEAMMRLAKRRDLNVEDL